MLTCGVALDQYYREHIAVKRVARRRAEYAIDALNGFFKDKPVDEINIPICRKYREHRSGVTDSTVRRELGTLQAAINHAIRWQRINLAEKPPIELPEAPATRPVWLFRDELSALLEAAESLDNRVFRFVQLAYHTASRRAAIEQLRWDQVDLAQRRIDLQAKGVPQTKKRRPIVPISETMCAELAIMRSAATTDFVLGTPDDIYQAFGRVATEAGLDVLPAQGLRQTGRLTPHMLRHSRATHLLQSGKSPWAVANLLGDTVTTVLRVYGHACPDYLAEVIG